VRPIRMVGTATLFGLVVWAAVGGGAARPAHAAQVTRPGVCSVPRKENQTHVTLPSSSASLDRGVSGLVVNVTGRIVAVQMADGTIATVYLPAGAAPPRAGQALRVAGTLRDGLVWASRVHVAGGAPWPAATTPAQPTGVIRHVIFIVQENHSFDNYFGAYPGVVGLRAGVRLPRRPGGRPVVAPFPLAGPIGRDLGHTWGNAHLAYARGAMSGFVYADGTRDVMGYYTGRQIPNYWYYASRYTLADMFFSSVMGPSLPNHLYTVAGSSGGWIWNMWQPPTGCGFRFATLPGQLQAHGASWTYYSGFNPRAFWLWNPLPGFSAFERSAALRHHLAWTRQYFRDLRTGRLPTVSWITPTKIESEHPPANNALGMWYVTDLVNALGQSRYWRDTVVVVTWDEYGGWYDGVAPRQVNAFGLGFRVPALIISPYAKAGAVDATAMSFASVLKYVDQVARLAPLNPTVAAATSVGAALDLGQRPLPPALVTGPLNQSVVPASRLPDRTVRRLRHTRAKRSHRQA